MSTPCNIGIINEDHSIDLIYCHFDGYPSYQTPILLSSYNTAEKVRELIALGDISSLGSNINPSVSIHSFDNPQKGVVVAYHRDRGEEWAECKPLHFENKADLKCRQKGYRGEYIYLFDSVRDVRTFTGNSKFKDITEPIQKG